ncbi:MAG: septum formation initiator family protein [Candidatus Nomurabacteria bacterium]|nr:septum formation initiator family protein [Candidatus Nomurabacteria bacterium]
MKNSQERSILNRYLHSKLGMVILCLFILFFGWNVIKFAGKAQQMYRDKNVAEQKIINLQKEKDRLSSDINKLNTQNGVDETIRDKFGLAKDGEGLVIIVDDKDKANNQDSQNDKSFWAYLKSWFK